MSQSPNLLSALRDLPARAVLEGLARLHQAVFAADGEGRVLWMSEQLGRLRGEDGLADSATWKAGHTAADYFREDGQLDELQRRLAREGRVHAQRADLLACNGRAVPVEIDGVRITASDGGALFIGVVRPVVDRETSERAALSSAILESASLPMLAVDGRGFIRHANSAVEALLGHPLEELTEKPVSMLAVSSEELAAAIVATDDGEDREVELRHADGSPRFVNVAATELRLPDGRHEGSVVVLHERSQQRGSGEDLRRKNSELEHYVQNVSHDLRSPLVSLLGFSHLLRQEYGDRMDETARHFLDRIEKAGRTMEALINDLLELSRIGGTRELKASVNVCDVLAQLQAELKPRLEAQGVRLRFPEQPFVVLCDRTRLYQVFSNLVGNALDYMGPVADPEIIIEGFEDPGEHRIVVRDNGRGIEPAQRERIFELFQTCGPRADGRRGTGIGLAIVKKIAQSQNGRVWVESRPGEGAAFHLTLPRS